MAKKRREKLDTETSLQLMRRLWREYLVEHKKKLWIGLVCMAISAAAVASHAWLMQPVLDEIFLEQDAQMLLLVPLAIFGIALINAAATYGQTLVLRSMGQRVIATMQQRLYAHLLRADLALFHDQSSGRLISRFTNDIYLMRHSLTSVTSGLIRDLLTLTFLAGVMIYQSPALAAVALIAFPTMIFPVIRLGRKLRRVTHQTQDELSHLASQLDETFQGVRMVKAYGREDFEIDRASQQIERLYALYLRAARAQAAASPITEIITGFAIAGVVYYGGIEVMEGDTTPGAFFSFITAMIMAYKPAKSLASLNNHLQEALAAASRLFKVLDAHPVIADAPDAASLQLREGRIGFEQVTFKYETEDEGRAGGVRDIDLQILPGQKVALVGPSGGGKSTLINLLLRFYDPQSGVITIDGQDICGLTLASLRQSMALVSQEIVLFDATIRQNIAYGRLDASDEEIEAAARGAAAHEFIAAMPQGYDTPIGPHGLKLSGGQRQRLAIARAMLKNAPILLLDEATSALDSEAEQQVQAALDELMQGRTTLVIAHRLSTIRHADKIVVLKDGRIEETGTHDELVSQEGVYAGLHSHQFQPGGF